MARIIEHEGRLDEVEEPSASVTAASQTVFDIVASPPFRLDLTAWALRRRRHNMIDVWDGSYRRTLLVGQRALAVKVDQHGGREHPVLSVSVLGGSGLGCSSCTADEQAVIGGQLRRLLGVDVDLGTFYALADIDPRLGHLKERMLGVRPPRFATLFEALANAIANQQLSLEVGITLLNRLAELLGRRAEGDQGPVAFPDALAVLSATIADLRDLGFSTRKAEYLLDSAEATASGTLDVADIEPLDRAEATERLMRLRGIGRWSAEYVLLRGIGRLDVFPADDVGARNKLERFAALDHSPGRDEILELLRPWAPCAGMIYFHLLLDGLAERGDIDA